MTDYPSGTKLRVTLDMEVTPEGDIKFRGGDGNLRYWSQETLGNAVSVEVIQPAIVARQWYLDPEGQAWRGSRVTPGRVYTDGMTEWRGPDDLPIGLRPAKLVPVDE